MASAIDVTKPASPNATTASIRANFVAAKAEIEALQAGTGLADNSVLYAKIQDVSSTDRILGRSAPGAGDIEEIVCTAAGRAILDDASAAAQRTTLDVPSNAEAILDTIIDADGDIVIGAAADTPIVVRFPSKGAYLINGKIDRRLSELGASLRLRGESND